MTEPGDQPLTTDQIRANADRWTLAGDVGLLAHLQQFAEHIIKKAEATESSLNNLLDSVEQTSTNFHNVSNQFLSLQNSQFLENRVYDDETPTDEIPQPVSRSMEESQQQTLERYKEAVTVGIRLLDTHFEEVILLENSDSEEEASDSNPALVLRPKSQYNKPLPLVIGSAEWWTDDNVGLGEFQENDDSEPEVSLSDSEPDVIRPQRSISSSSLSSMEEIIEAKKPNLPAIITIPAMDEPPALPTNNDDDDDDMFKPVDDLFGYAQERSKPNLFDSKNIFASPGDDLFVKPSQNLQPQQNIPKPNTVDGLFDADNDSSTPAEVKPKTMNRVSNAFTKELVAKLGSVAKNQENGEESPKNEVKKVEDKQIPGLFDDDISPKKPALEFVKPVPPIAKPLPKPERKASSMGLFGEDLEDDDDLFAGVGRKSSVTNVRAKESGPSKLFDDDDDDDLFGNVKKRDAVSEKKQTDSSTYDSTHKPTGGPSNLFSGIDDDLDNLFAPKSVPKIFSSVKMPVGQSRDNSPVAGAVKTSTPALQVTTGVQLNPTPSDDLFGSISRVADESREQSLTNNESPHFNEESQIVVNPADVGMVNDTENESRDLGFIETSSLSETDNSKKDSQSNWFHPQLSSTQAVGLSHETSGYKTATVWTGGESAGTDSPSDSKPREKRFSSILEDSSPTQPNKLKEDDLFAGPSIKSSTGDDLDDLFSSGSKPEKSSSRRVKIASDFFQSTDTEDLFSAKPVEKKTSQSKVWKPASIFDDEDDNSLFDDGKNKLPDNVSVSSSRSSLFEEPAAGKSTLPSIFEKKGEVEVKSGFKVSLFENVDDDFDLFGGKKEEKVPRGADSILESDDLFKAPSRVAERPTPPSTLGVKKSSDLLKDEPDGEVNVAVSKKIGKINIPSSLKINPVALLPGVRPVKTTPTEGGPSLALNEEPSLDVSSSGFLSSAARDRPRIQVKRRPQSRKARQEALRVSGIDFGNVDVVSPGSDKEGTNSLFHSAENSPSPAFMSIGASSVLSPSTDEEDYFNIPELDSNGKEESVIFSKDEQNVVAEEDGFLFDSGPVISPTEKKRDQVKPNHIPDVSAKKPTLFKSVGGSDDDLFGASVPSSSLFDDHVVPKNVTTTAKPKVASLFGDDDDDDDIFVNKSEKLATSAVKKDTKPTTSNVEKVKENFIDPLGLLHDQY